MRLRGDGRPLRFLLMLLLAWTGIRVGWPGASDTRIAPKLASSVRRMAPALWPSASAAEADPAPSASRPAASRPSPIALVRGTSGQAVDQAIDLMDFIRFAVAFANRDGQRLAQDALGLRVVSPDPGGAILPVRPTADRWSAAAWVLWRGGSASAAAAPAGRLGGSQAGVRVDYDLFPQASHRVSAYARASTAFDRPTGPEGAVGIAWQPARAIPVTIAAERRVALGEGARNATALYVAGGIGPTDIGSAMRLEGYTQAGVVGLRSKDGFVDGKTSLSWRLPVSTMRPGISLSGGAQPGLSRLDIGPELHFPVRAGGSAMRISAEWRERIAGNAAPGSGLTLTIAANF